MRGTGCPVIVAEEEVAALGTIMCYVPSCVDREVKCQPRREGDVLARVAVRVTGAAFD